MSQVARAAVALALGGVLVLASASPAAAVFPFISTELTGEAIDGEVPEGFARVNQSHLFVPRPGRLYVALKNVNLPDGTVLTVVMTDCMFGPVMTITLERGKARATFTLPSGPCQVGHNSSIFLNHGDTRVLAGGSPWEVGK